MSSAVRATAPIPPAPPRGRAARAPPAARAPAAAAARRRAGRRGVAVVRRCVNPFDKAVQEIALPLRHEDIIRQQAAEKGLDPALIAAVIYTESRFRDQTSHAGATGLMQLMPVDRATTSPASPAAPASPARTSRRRRSTSPTAPGTCATCSTSYDGNDGARARRLQRGRGQGRRVVAGRPGARRALRRGAAHPVRRDARLRAARARRPARSTARTTRASSGSTRAPAVTGRSRRAGIGCADRAAAGGAGSCAGWAAQRAEDAARALREARPGVAGRDRARRLRRSRTRRSAAWPGRAAPLDILVVNHAHSSDRGLGELDAAEIDRALAVNVRAALLLVQAFHARHDGRPGGRVILMTSGQHRGADARRAALHRRQGRAAPAHAQPRRRLRAASGSRSTASTPAPPTPAGPAPDVHAEVLARGAVRPLGRARRRRAADRVPVLAGGRWVTGQVITSSGGGP